jgi:hypothetical protein
MGVASSEVGYTSATTAGGGDHEVRKGHVVALDKKRKKSFAEGQEGNLKEEGLRQFRFPISQWA